MQLYNQCDSRWGVSLLGAGTNRGTLCAFGCWDAVLAMIANASGHPCVPSGLNNLFVAKGGIFFTSGGGAIDLLPDNALDKLFPGDYQTTVYAGFRADLVKVAIPSSDTYVAFRIEGYAPVWKQDVGHFVMGWTADGAYIADPQGGIVRALSAYGGSTNVKRTIIIKRLAPKPVPTPVPVPVPMVYTVVSNKIVLATDLSYDAAVAAANTYSKGHVGILYEVLDSTGKTVTTAFIPVPPAPIPPAPQPKPIPIDGREELAGILQNFLVALLMMLKKRLTPNQVQA